MRTLVHIKTSQEFAALIRLGETTESVSVDFKATYKEKAERGDEIRKDTVALANTWGGCLLLGVSEAKAANGLKVANDIAEIDVDVMRNMVADAISQRIYPPIDVECVPIEVADIRGARRMILSVNVNPMLDGAACIDFADGRLLVPYRDDHGVKFFRAHEVYQHMNSSARRIQLLVKRFSLIGTTARIASDVFYVRPENQSELAWRLAQTDAVGPELGRRVSVREAHSNPVVEVKSMSDTHLALSFHASTFSVPYSLISDLWPDPHGTVQLALNCPLTFDERTKRVVLNIGVYRS